MGSVARHDFKHPDDHRPAHLARPRAAVRLANKANNASHRSVLNVTGAAFQDLEIYPEFWPGPSKPFKAAQSRRKNSATASIAPSQLPSWVKPERLRGVRSWLPSGHQYSWILRDKV